MTFGARFKALFRAVSVFAVLGLVSIGPVCAQADPLPPGLRGLTVVLLDAGQGFAVVRCSKGEYRTLRHGDTTPDKALRVARFYGDRIEFESIGSSKGTRYWLAASESSILPTSNTISRGN